MRVLDLLARPVDVALEASVVGSFSRVGIETRRRLARWDPYPDMTGCVVIVTGATSGIGAAAAEEFARLGASVCVVGRDSRRARAAAERIRTATGSALVEWALADLVDLDQAAAFAEAFAATHDRLDVLVHNAGALDRSFHLSRQGYEATYASQVLSQHVITSHLLPLLAATGDARVVVVSSGGMYTESLVPEQVQLRALDYDGVKAYARAKRAQVSLTSQWALRFAASGIVFHAMHPGWADTPGVRTSLPTFHRLTGPFLRSPQEGADTVVWLGSSDDALQTNGGFWMDRRARSTARLPGTAGDRATEEALWDLVCRQSGATPRLARSTD
jgi:dehydrogenase/reductase SDR family member 12